MSNYHAANYLKGAMGRDIVRSLLERSGYTVCSYGYEETLLDAKSKYTYKKYCSPTGRRLTHSPDLLVYDAEDVVMLVEIKTRGKTKQVKAGEVWIDSKELSPLKDHWNDSILAVVAEEDDVFYAQKISDLEFQKNDRYPLTSFKKFQDFFTKVTSESINYHKNVALQMFKIFTQETGELVYSPERWKGIGEEESTASNEVSEKTADSEDFGLCKDCHSRLIITPDRTKVCPKCGLVVGKGHSLISGERAGGDQWDGSVDNSERIVENDHW